MLNSEPQTYVITSETLQILVLLSDLSKIPNVRTLLSLKKASIEKDIFEKGKKRLAIFSRRCMCIFCTFPSPPSSYTTVINCYLKTIKSSFRARNLNLRNVPLMVKKHGSGWYAFVIFQKMVSKGFQRFYACKNNQSQCMRLRSIQLSIFNIVK